MSHDPVSKPSHYLDGRKITPVDVVEDWGLGFSLGNCVKYIGRAGRKTGESLEQDLGKAAWYLQRERERIAPGTTELEQLRAFKTRVTQLIAGDYAADVVVLNIAELVK